MYDDRLIFKYLCIREELAGRIRSVLNKEEGAAFPGPEGADREFATEGPRADSPPVRYHLSALVGEPRQTSSRRQGIEEEAPWRETQIAAVRFPSRRAASAPSPRTRAAI